MKRSDRIGQKHKKFPFAAVLVLLHHANPALNTKPAHAHANKPGHEQRVNATFMPSSKAAV